MHHRSRAIILRRTAYGEADLIVTFYSRERGRLSGIARSARVSKRRFAGALEPGSVVEMGFTEGSASQLVRLSEATVVWPINGAMKSLERIRGLARAIQLALAFLQEREANQAKFDLLLGRIAALCERDPEPSGTAAFELAWLALSGFAPALGGCVACGEAVPGSGRGWRISFERGGLLCPRCGLGDGGAMALSREAVSGLVALASGGVPDDGHGAAAAGAVLGAYIDHVLGRPIAPAGF